LDADGEAMEVNGGGCSSFGERAPVPFSWKAHFMPDNTNSIRVDVKSARFADATEWEAQR
jgi:hypothetical protein